MPFNGTPTCSGDLSGACGAPHYSVPTLGTLQWNSGSDVDLVFNASENGGNSINIPAGALTLSFYNWNTNIFSISNTSALFFPDTNPGTGNIGFGIGVSERARRRKLQRVWACKLQRLTHRTFFDAYAGRWRTRELFRSTWITDSHADRCPRSHSGCRTAGIDFGMQRFICAGASS